MVERAPTKTAGPGVKEKQEKSSTQPVEQQQEQAEQESDANHGGRDEWPDSDVNPATEIHIDDGEDGELARTDDHDASRREDKSDSDGEDRSRRGRSSVS